jgi:hypothetical protein
MLPSLLFLMLLFLVMFASNRLIFERLQNFIKGNLWMVASNGLLIADLREHWHWLILNQVLIQAESLLENYQRWEGVTDSAFVCYWRVYFSLNCRLIIINEGFDFFPYVNSCCRQLTTFEVTFSSLFLSSVLTGLALGLHKAAHFVKSRDEVT